MCFQSLRLLYTIKRLSLQYTIKLLVLQREATHELTNYFSKFLNNLPWTKIVCAEALPTQFGKFLSEER